MKYSLLVIFSCFVSLAFAQTHQNLWLRGTIGYQINRHIKFDIEFQHRRQNGFNNYNLADKNLMYTCRPWIHYQFSKNIKFSISPLAYFSNYKIISVATDANARPIDEKRITMAIEMQKNLDKKSSLFYRPAAEYRIITHQPHHIIRVRNRLGFRYTIKKQIKCYSYDELLLNVYGVQPTHLFDHNRLAIGAEYHATPSIKIDCGYIRIYRKANASNIYTNENNWMINFSFLIPSFKKK